VAHVGRGDESFDFELVGEEQEADKGLAVIGLAEARGEAADVGEDEDARAVGGGEGYGGEEKGGEPNGGHLLLSQLFEHAAAGAKPMRFTS
jgi:hypothetical protein